MRRFLHSLRQTAHRLGTFGLRPTLTWLVGHGVPCLTGVPILSLGQITPFLVIGGQHGRAGKRKLERLGFSASVNLRGEFDDVACGLALAQSCHLPTVDRQAPTVEQLLQGIAFIRRIVGTGGKVFVHCQSGVGRAPTLAAAYLIAEGYEVQDAVDLVCRARPFIALTDAQRIRLQAFRDTLKRPEGRYGRVEQAS